MRPLLEKTVELSRELAAFHTGYANPYDALIDLEGVDEVYADADEIDLGLPPRASARSPARRRRHTT